ncbi:MAG: CPBP family intramembrane metalloprotease [Ignavibacteriae bacterium]|nr:CPBP family intramembrane metalloprotease [Ignavibacteriota bacterium]
MQDTFNSNQLIPAEINKPKFSHIKFANKYFIIIILIYLLSGVIIELIYPHQYGKLLGYLQGLAQLLLMLIPVLIFSRLSPLPFKTLFRLEYKPDLKLLLLSILGILALYVFETTFLILQEKLIPDFLIEIYKATEKSINDLYSQILGGSGIIDCLKALAIGAVVPALSEEFLFRGFYQRSLEEELKPYLAILISGLIFAVVHINPINIIPLISIGIYLGVIAYGTKSLIIPILLHFLNNAIAVVIMYTPSLSSLDEQSYNLTITSAVILSTISLAILAFVSVVIYRKGKK